MLSLKSRKKPGVNLSDNVKDSGIELNIDTDATYTLTEEPISTMSAPPCLNRIHAGTDVVCVPGNIAYIKKF